MLIAPNQLPYGRSQLKVGAPLVGWSSSYLRKMVSCGRPMVFRPESKLGDSLLMLGGVSALRSLASDGVWLDADAPAWYDWCIDQPTGAPLFVGRRSLDARDVLISGSPATSHSGEQVVLSPERSVAILSEGRRYSALPDRYYLAIEQASGRRLVGAPPFCPLVVPPRSPALDHSNSPGRVFKACIIVATSLPERKAADPQVMVDALSALAKSRAVRLSLRFVRGREAFPLERITFAEHVVEAFIVDLPSIENAALYFAGSRFDVVVSNDTGLGHLAAMVRCGDYAPPVLMLHDRHAYGKWRTGLANHHSLPSERSVTLEYSDACPIRDCAGVAWADSIRTLSAEVLTLRLKQVLSA